MYLSNEFQEFKDTEPIIEDLSSDIPQSSDPLQCNQCTHKPFKSKTWLDKHKIDKHGVTGNAPFSSPESLKDYVQNVTGTGIPDLTIEEPTKSDGDISPKVTFEVTQEQAKQFISSFNIFMDSILELIFRLDDFEHYSKMTQATMKNMAGSIALYFKHTGRQVSAGVFLILNLLLAYGSMTVQLTKNIRRSRLIEEEKRKVIIKKPVKRKKTN